MKEKEKTDVVVQFIERELHRIFIRMQLAKNSGVDLGKLANVEKAISEIFCVKEGGHDATEQGGDTKKNKRDRAKHPGRRKSAKDTEESGSTK